MAFAGDNLQLLVDIDAEDCWLWTGTLDKFGYPRKRYYRGESLSPRLILYEVFIGPVAPELVLDHLCHTADEHCKGGPTCIHRRCVNPLHMDAVTVGENSQRKSKSWRGASIAAINARKTHCPKGHPYDEENTMHRGGRFPGRICRTCARAANREYAKRKPRKVYEPRRCAVCGTEFTPRRSDRVLCGTRRCKRIYGNRVTH